jgi:Holliday junction DNA helicase RuvA subunit
MLERVQGVVVATQEKSVTVMVQGLGLQLLLPDPLAVITGREQLFFTIMHWTQDKGPQIIGFLDEYTREVFSLLITCQKIGPVVALTLLRQRSASMVVHDIISGNCKGLSSCQGIGAKKAEQIVYELKEKVGHLVRQEGSGGVSHKGLAHVQQMQEALESLGYSKQEIADVTSYVAAAYKDDMPAFALLMRKALSYLSAQR